MVVNINTKAGGINTNTPADILSANLADASTAVNILTDEQVAAQQQQALEQAAAEASSFGASQATIQQPIDRSLPATQSQQLIDTIPGFNESANIIDAQYGPTTNVVNPIAPQPTTPIPQDIFETTGNAVIEGPLHSHIKDQKAKLADPNTTAEQAQLITESLIPFGVLEADIDYQLDNIQGDPDIGFMKKKLAAVDPVGLDHFLGTSDSLAKTLEATPTDTPGGRAAWEVFRKKKISNEAGKIDPSAAKALLLSLAPDINPGKFTGEASAADFDINQDIDENLNPEIDHVSQIFAPKGRQAVGKDGSGFPVYENIQDDFVLQNEQLGQTSRRLQQIIQDPDDYSAGEIVRQEDTSADEESAFASHIFNALEQLDLVERVAPSFQQGTTLRHATSFNASDKLLNVLSSVSRLGDAAASRYNIPVSLVPLPDGKPGGQSQLNYSDRTSGPVVPDSKKASLQKAKVAMDIAGKVPNTIDKSGTVMLTNMLATVSGQLHPIFGYSNDPATSILSLDSKTFFKVLPTPQDLYDLWASANSKNFQETRAAHFKRFVQAVPEYLTVNITTEKQLETVWNGLTKPQQADFNNRRLSVATGIQDALVAKALEDIADIYDFNDKTFYYPQKFVTANGRIMVATDQLNYQRSKLIRSLVVPPRFHIASSIDLENQITTARRTGGKIGYPKAGLTFDMLTILSRSLDSLHIPNGQLNPPSLDTGTVVSDVEAIDSMMNALISDSDGPVLKRLAEIAHGLVNNEANINFTKAFKEQAPNLAGLRPQTAGKTAAAGFGKMSNDALGETASAADLNLLMEAVGLGRLEAGPTDPVTEVSTPVLRPTGDVEHAFYQLRSLAELGKLIKSPKGAKNSYRITAHIDGISNGIAIQAATLGDTVLMKRTGYVDPEDGGEDVKSKGDTRDLTHETALAYVNEGIARPEVKLEQELGPDGVALEIAMPTAGKGLDAVTDQEIMRSILLDIESVGALKKSLYKTPNMVVSYSMTPSAAAKQGLKTLLAELAGHPDIAQNIEDHAAKTGLDWQSNMIELVEVGIVASLGSTIALTKMLENMGALTLLSGSPLTVTTGSGADVVFGKNSAVRGSHKLELAKVGPDGELSAGVKDFGKYHSQYNPAFKDDFSDVWGSKAAKKLAVGLIHSTDGAIAVETMIKTLKAIEASAPKSIQGTPEMFINKDVNQPSFYALQIFDAFQLDIGSFRIGREQANRAFVNVIANERSNPVFAVKREFDRQLKLIKDRVKAMPDKVVLKPLATTTAADTYTDWYHAFANAKVAVTKTRRNTSKLPDEYKDVFHTGKPSPSKEYLGVVSGQALVKQLRIIGFPIDSLKIGDQNASVTVDKETMTKAIEVYIRARSLDSMMSQIDSKIKKANKHLLENQSFVHQYWTG